MGRKHQREQQDRGERERPEHRQDEPHSLPERPRLRGIERTEPADDRHRRVRQDRHLQQLDVGVGDDLQRRRPLADEQPQRHAAGDPDGDSCRRREAPLRRGASFVARHGLVHLSRNAIPRDERGHIVVASGGQRQIDERPTLVIR